MGKIDPKRLAEELQKAKFKGIPASEVVKKLKDEANASVSPKKEDAPVVVQTVGAKLGDPIQQSLAGKAKSFTQSMISRGLNNNKASEETYSLRVLSCNGTNIEKGLPPCPHRMNSTKFENSFYCGACGCGDKQLTQLMPFTVNGKMIDYTKLNYPKVNCPLEMPGFTNYKSNAESAKTANDRKQFIEFNESVDYIKSKSNP
jgi:hypothetical protein